MNGLMLALPLITLLLTLNMALGMLNRMTPQLSVFVIGFPLTLTVGIISLGLIMPLLAPFTEHLFGEFFDRPAGGTKWPGKLEFKIAVSDSGK